MVFGFFFFPSFLSTLEYERLGFGKLLYCLKSSYIRITNIVQVAKHRLAHFTGLLLFVRAKCSPRKPGRQFAPSGAIPKKHAYVQGWIFNASKPESDGLILENGGKWEPAEVDLLVIVSSESRKRGVLISTSPLRIHSLTAKVIL